MSDRRVHGLPVDLDEVSRALNETRILRLALNVLYDNLSSDIVDGPVEDIFCKIHDHLSEAETSALVRFGLAEHYVIIRPISPARPPEPAAMKEIAAAINTLEEHDMLVQSPDARNRD